ncbi:MAG: AAA-like domain-containing protein [Actinomycetota bacterium]
MNGELGVAEWEEGNNAQSHLSPLPTPHQASAELELPGGQVPLDSAFYVHRSPIEERCYSEIQKPGALIRIKAPARSGKTSLMSRVLSVAREHHYRTVTLSFQLASASVFTNLDRFLQWFCASVGKSLGLPVRVTDYWDEIFGSNYNCTDYFENYLLASHASPIVLALDDVDRVFQYPEIASEFFGLLRAWYEKAKYGDSGSASFEKLRLVVVHSTEVYIPLNINQSPFNVGMSVELPELTSAQVQDLAIKHEIELSETQVEQLMAMVGGNPYLVRLGLYHIKCGDVSFEQCLATAYTEDGIYKEHLRRQRRNLQQAIELTSAFEMVVIAEGPVELEPLLAYRLQSMGLVRLNGNLAMPSCNLYRQYFHPAPNRWELLNDRIAKLERANQELQQLVKVDSLTQLANRGYFDEYLNSEWRRLAHLKLPLSLVLCDVDFFKLYNDTFGHPNGDQCLQEVAKTIAKMVKLPDALVARYGGEEFALILPNTPVELALSLAETIRLEIKALEMSHTKSKVSPWVTLSLGLTTMTPNLESSSALIVRVADQALYQAKAQGRDRTVVKLLSENW